MSESQLDPLITIPASTYVDKKGFGHKTCYNKCDKQKYERKLSAHADVETEPPAKKVSLESTKDEAVSRESLLLSSKRATSIDGERKTSYVSFMEMQREKSIFPQQKNWMPKYAIMHLCYVPRNYLLSWLKAIWPQLMQHIICNVLWTYTTEFDRSQSPEPKKTSVRLQLRLPKLLIIFTVIVVKLSEFKSLYYEYFSLARFNSPGNADAHSTWVSERFKDKIMEALPYLSAYQKTYNTFNTFQR